MADVYLGRISRWVEKLFNIKGGPAVVDINHQVQSVLSLQPGNEERYLLGWSRFGIFVNQGAVAAQFGAVQFNNKTSNLIVVFEKLTIAEGAVDNPEVRLKAAAADFGVSTPNTQRLDPRQQQTLSAMTLSQGATAAKSGNIIMFGQIPTTTSPLVEFITLPTQEIVVAPGDALTVYAGVVNTPINVGAIWRERALESSELT